LVADSHSILARERNDFSQLLNVYGVNNVRQTEIHTTEPLVPEPSVFEVEMAIEKLKSHESPGIDQIQAQMNKAGGRTICYEIHELIISIWNKEAYAKEITGDHQCGFRCNRSATVHILCIHQILEKKWEYNEVVHQLFINFKKAYDSVSREVSYNILIEFGIPMKLIRLIKMCLPAKYSRAWEGKNLSDMFPIRNGWKQGDALSPLLFNFALEYAIRKV